MLKRIKPVSMVLLVSTLCFSGNIYAASSAGNPDTDILGQNTKVTGVVEDALGPVAGASVVIKGTTNGTMTDMDGNFTLEWCEKGGYYPKYPLSVTPHRRSLIQDKPLCPYILKKTRRNWMK
mgnify:CR=1 FL=1